MSAKNNIGPECAQPPDKRAVYPFGEPPPDPRNPPGQAGVIRPFENRGVELWCMLDQFQIGFAVDFPVKPRGALENIQFFNFIFRPPRFPRLFERRRRLHMSRSGRNGADQYAHVFGIDRI